MSPPSGPCTTAPAGLFCSFTCWKIWWNSWWFDSVQGTLHTVYRYTVNSSTWSHQRVSHTRHLVGHTDVQTLFHVQTFCSSRLK